jgi:RNA polymerase-interacting CarD/CdnL/TRCF family regulator
MGVRNHAYKIGDWIVHLMYGVGQIKKLEKRPIGGEEQLCYRVRTDDGTFWLPADNADNERVRPIASSRRIQRALKVLREAPRKMAKNFKTRQKRIRDVTMDGDLNTDMQLVRDLNARQLGKGLNTTEQHALESITKRFSKEWALSKGMKVQEARQKLNQFLQEGRSKGKSEKDPLAS